MSRFASLLACAALAAGLATGPALAAGQRDTRPMSTEGKNLGNDRCDKQVRAKYPSGTMGNKARLRLVEACREGRSW